MAASKKAAKANPRRRRRAGAKRKRRNPTAAKVTAPRRTTAIQAKANPRRRKSTRRRRNPARRVSNPRSTSLFALALTAGGIVATEFIAGNVLGPQSGIKGIVIKGAIGYGLMEYGKKLPFVGKHSEAIGGGLLLLAAVDGFRQFAWPRIVGSLPVIPGLTAPLQSGAGVAGLVDYNPNYGMSGLVDAAGPAFIQ